MSTSLHDFPSAVTVAAGLSPATLTGNATGPAVDLADADGPCFAVQLVGALTDTTLTGRIEQSATGASGWTAISGAEFTPETDAEKVQVIRFTPTARYVRWAADVTDEGDPSVAVAVVIGQQKKSI
ncbi:MAG TPA: hypothetical protein VKE74_11840 [Gemmataceae bacterium]|nr:hypothetical protein [Gemmataceae bacterium]